MTQEQLKQFEELNELFQNRCEIICKLLEPLNKNYKYLYDFEIDENKVVGKGDEYLGYGGTEYHCISFPKEYLYKDDDDIEDLVYIEIVKRNKQRLEEEQNKKEIKLKREKEEYERLKAKFG